MAMLECVGKLYRWDPLTKQATDPHAISAFQPLIVGRNRKLSQYVFDDECVSNHHLRIYTVIYDLEDPLDVAPLVYAQDISTNGTFWNGQRIDKRNGGAVLLSDGDILRLSSKSFLEFRSDYQSKRPLNLTQQKETMEFANEYLITDRILGEGGFGQVRMAINLNTTGQVACKIVNFRAVKEVVTKRKDEYGTNLLDLQKREVDILQRLCHPNIIGVEKVFTMESSLYIFEDLITAGDLFTFVESKGGSITDFETASVIRQVLIAIDYLHDNNIVHRDLKPENILMTSNGVQRRVVLADFGCAQAISPGNKRMSTVVGTWDYTAPEVYKEVDTGYTKSVDLWSVGCVTVVLLIGMPPFTLPTSGNIEYIEPGDLSEVFMNSKWGEASAMAQNFVLSLLILDERKRLTAKQALQHSWFMNEQYRSRLEQLYEEAIRNWHPPNCVASSKSENCVHFVHKISDKARRSAPTSTLELSKSQIVTSVPKEPAISNAGRNTHFGKAKSSGHAQSMHVSGSRDKICVAQSSTPSPDTCTPLSSLTFKSTHFSKQLAPSFCSADSHPASLRVSDPEGPRMNLTTAQKSWAYTSKRLNDRFSMPTGMPGVTSEGISGVKRHFDETHSQSPEMDEVYEEFENKITGKVQRVLYKEK